MSTHAQGRDPLPVAVIGCGRMGRLHARCYGQMPQVTLVGVHDASASAAQETARQFNTTAFASAGPLLDRAKAVSIAVPTEHHLTVAEPFLKRGIACLIEKPLARDEQESRRIVELARDGGAVVQVGHIERFNPAVRALEKMQLRPRFIEVARISPMTFRSIDVGVVLDMMIHDLDIVLKLAGSKVARVEAAGVSVIGGVEDICNARLTFENGCVANVTASRLAMRTERRLRVFASDAYVSIDYQKKEGIVVRRAGNLEAVRQAVAQIRSGQLRDLAQVNFQDMVRVEKLPTDDVEPIRAELEAFVAAATGQSAPAVTAEEGLAAVSLAGRIVAAIPQDSSV